MGLELLLAIEVTILVAMFGFLIVYIVKSRRGVSAWDGDGTMKAPRKSTERTTNPTMATTVKTKPINILVSVREIRKLDSEKAMIGMEVDTADMGKFDIGMPFNLIGEHLVEEGIETPTHPIDEGGVKPTTPEGVVSSLLKQFDGKPEEAVPPTPQEEPSTPKDTLTTTEETTATPEESASTTKIPPKESPKEPDAKMPDGVKERFKKLTEKKIADGKIQRICIKCKKKRWGKKLDKYGKHICDDCEDEAKKKAVKQTGEKDNAEQDQS